MARKFTPEVLKFERDKWIKEREQFGGISILPENETFRRSIAKYLVDEM
jgi:hypothetical protein